MVQNSDGELLLAVKGEVGHLYLNRPEVHNAISRNMWERLPGELEQLKQRGAKVIVISGKETSFAAGADLVELSQLKDYETAKNYWSSIATCLNAVAAFPLPTVAMIHGACMGGGLLLSIACDLRYATEEATFALPIARLGIVLDDENIDRLVSLVGVPKAKELLYLARSITAAHAEEIGLINGAVNTAHLEQLVNGITREIVSNAQNSIEQAKLSCARIMKGKMIESIERHKPQDEKTVVGSYLGDEFRKRSNPRPKGT